MKTSFTNIKKIITSNIGKTSNYGRSLFTILGIISILGSISTSIYIDEFQGVILILGIGIGGLMLINGNNWLISKRNLILQEILSLNTFFQKNLRNIDNITTILDKIDTMNLLLNKMKRNLFFTDIFYSDSVHNEQSITFKKEILLLVTYLRNLQSDLIIRLAEQQSTLEQAKYEVSTHIHGTNELNQVSELQRQRLDKQIEQFEELEKILIKI